MTQDQREKQLQELMNRTIIRCNNELNKSVQQAARVIVGNDLGLPKTPAQEKAYNKIFTDLSAKIQSAIENGIVSANDLANGHIDKELIDYVGKRKLDAALKKQMFLRNNEALKNQLTRAVDGKVLSDRVWNIAKTAQDGIEQIVLSDVGQSLLTGKSASKVATQIKHHLVNPDKRFRRVRDKNGKLIPSNPMKEYHPGQGVYRSSYKNALRLSADQVNQSYRMAEHERHQSIDFIVGYEICISNNHPVMDICDYMKGVYPKDYIWRGWHTLCRCFKKAIFLPEHEFDRYLSGEVDDLKSLSESYMVKNIPEEAKGYLIKNKQVFAGWKNTPYFLTDNAEILKQTLDRKIIMPDGTERNVNIIKYGNTEILIPKDLNINMQQITEEDIKEYINQIPEEHRGVIKEVRLLDQYYIENDKTLINTSATFDTKTKSIEFYSNAQWKKERINEVCSGSMRHEAGHALEDLISSKNPQFLKDWQEALVKDGSHITDYAKTDIFEDVAETLKFYWSPNKIDRRTVEMFFPKRYSVLQKYGIKSGGVK